MYSSFTTVLLTLTKRDFDLDDNLLSTITGTKPLDIIHKTRIFNLNVGKQRVKTVSHTPLPHTMLLLAGTFRSTLNGGGGGLEFYMNNQFGRGSPVFNNFLNTFVPDYSSLVFWKGFPCYAVFIFIFRIVSDVHQTQVWLESLILSAVWLVSDCTMVYSKLYPWNLIPTKSSRPITSGEVTLLVVLLRWGTCTCRSIISSRLV